MAPTRCLRAPPTRSRPRWPRCRPSRGARPARCGYAWRCTPARPNNATATMLAQPSIACCVSLIWGTAGKCCWRGQLAIWSPMTCPPNHAARPGRATAQRPKPSRADFSAPNPQPLTPNPQAYSQVLLDELERANLFIVPLDETRQWYRYHHLFVDVLRGRLS